DEELGLVPERRLDHAAQARDQREHPVAAVVLVESEVDRLRAALAAQLGEIPRVTLAEDACHGRGDLGAAAFAHLARVAPVELLGQQLQIREYFALVGLGDPVDVGLGEVRGGYAPGGTRRQRALIRARGDEAQAKRN